MSRYKYTKLLKLGPVDGFIIHTPDDLELIDTHPQTIVRELNRMADRIKRLEEAGDYLCAAAAFMGWHDKIETWNKAKEAKP